MAGFTGMDVEQVRQLARQMEQKASEIEQIKQQLNGTLNSAQWVGQDQQRYKSEWDSTCVPSLNRVIEILRDAGQAAERNAREQEQASLA